MKSRRITFILCISSLLICILGLFFLWNTQEVTASVDNIKDNRLLKMEGCCLNMTGRGPEGSLFIWGHLFVNGEAVEGAHISITGEDSSQFVTACTYGPDWASSGCDYMDRFDREIDHPPVYGVDIRQIYPTGSTGQLLPETTITIRTIYTSTTGLVYLSEESRLLTPDLFQYQSQYRLDITPQLSPIVTQQPMTNEFWPIQEGVKLNNGRLQIDTSANLIVSDVIVQEGVLFVEIPLLLQGIYTEAVTIEYATHSNVYDTARINSSCSGGATHYDFIDNFGTLTWQLNEFNSTKIVTIEICDDPIYEPIDETFTIELNNLSTAPIVDNEITVTVEDNDVQPTLSLTPLSVDENGGTANFTLQMNGGVSAVAEGNYRTVNDSAVSGTDFTFVDASWTLLANEENPSATLSVPILNDPIQEGDEIFDIQLYNIPSSINMANLFTFSIEIVDDEPAPDMTVSNVTASNVTVQESLGGVAYLTVNMDAPCANPVTVYYTTQAGTATSGEDFTTTSGSETWPAGASGNRTFNIPVLQDNLYEPGEDETFIVNFSLDEPSCAQFPSGTLSVTVSIQDDDNAPTVALSNVSVTEGDGNAVLVATMTGGHTDGVVISCETADGATGPLETRAIANGTYNDDYQEHGSASPLRFEWDSDEVDGTASVTIVIHDDSIDEASEQFTVENCSIDTGTITGNINDFNSTITILDDGDVAVLTVVDEVIEENANGGFPQAQIEVELVGGHTQGVDVDYATILTLSDVARDNNNCSSGSTWYDFIGVSGLTLSWDVDEHDVSRFITIDVCNDPIYEGATNETFTVELDNAINATLADDVATVSIVDDDIQPTLVITPLVTDEDVGTAVFTLQMNGGVSAVAQGRYRTIAGSAVITADLPFTDAQWTLPANQENPSTTLSVMIRDDGVREGDEEFFIELYHIPTSINMTEPTQFPIEIIDDEPAPHITVNDVLVSESATSATINVNMDATCAETVFVYYENTSQIGTAISNQDFSPVSDFVAFPPGNNATRTFTIPIINDNIYEPGGDETFIVTFSLDSPSCAEFPTGTLEATVSIQDNEAMPSVRLVPVGPSTTLDEGDSIQFNALLSGPTDEIVTVDYTVVTNTAENNDYSMTGTMLTWPAYSVTTRTITIDTSDDIYYENTETLDIVLQSPVNASLGTPDSHTVTIIDDESVPAISFSDTTAVVMPEGNTYLVAIQSTVPSEDVITVSYRGVDGTTSDYDYYPSEDDIIETVDIPSVQQNATVSVTVWQDHNYFEPHETFQLVLYSATNGAVIDMANNTKNVTISDSPIPVPPDVSFVAPTAQGEEGDTVNVGVTVDITHPLPITVSYNVNFITGGAFDTSPNTGIVVIPANTLTADIPILLYQDALPESDEQFRVTLVSATDGINNASINGTYLETILTILNNDIAISIQGPTTFQEPPGNGNNSTDGGDPPAYTNRIESHQQIEVGLSAASSYPITVPYTFLGNAMNPPGDPAVNGIAIFGGAGDYSGDCNHPYGVNRRTDYYSQTGLTNSIIFAPGEITKTIDLRILGNCQNPTPTNSNYESPYEIFYLNFSASAYPVCVNNTHNVCLTESQPQFRIESCYIEDATCPANDYQPISTPTTPNLQEPIHIGLHKKPFAKRDQNTQAMLPTQTSIGQATSTLLTLPTWYQWRAITITTSIPDQTAILATLLDNNQQPIAGFIEIPLQDGQNQLDLTSLEEQSLFVSLSFSSEEPLLNPQVLNWQTEWLPISTSSNPFYKVAGVMENFCLTPTCQGELSNVRLQLWEVNGSTPVMTTTRKTDHTYEFTGFQPDFNKDYLVRTVLAYERDGHTLFTVHHVDDETPVYFESVPFQFEANTSFTTHNLHFDLKRNRETYHHNLGEYGDRLTDLLVLYTHTAQVFDFMYDRIGLDTLLPLVKVKAFMPNLSSAWYNEEYHIIEYGAHYSRKGNSNRPMNREWHETFHHLMTASVGVPFSDCDGNNNNYGGFDNCATSDSWAEGWAIYWSMLLGIDLDYIDGGFYKVDGAEVSLEYNWQAWAWYDDCLQCSSREMYAVASLLLDLSDYYSLDYPYSLGVYERDYVEIREFHRIWELLAYSQANNIHDLYQHLKRSGLGQGRSWSHSCGMTDLDALFVLHGFFYDENTNGYYDCGEILGRSGNGYTGIRRSIPGTNTFIELQTATTTPITVTVAYEYLNMPELNYQYEVLATNGLLYIEPVPSSEEVNISIMAHTTNTVSSEPITMTNQTYWQSVADYGQTSPVVQSHTLNMVDGQAIQLERGWNLLSIPLALADTSPEMVFGNNVGLAYSYDGCDTVDPWKRYDPDPILPNDLTSITPDVGYWLYTAIPTTFAVTGTHTVSNMRQLCEGWNLVSSPVTQTMPIEIALADIADHLIQVYGYDSTDTADPWKRYDPNPILPNDLFFMQPNQSYWIHVDQPITWEP